jgi:hypothetical protein
MLSLYDKLRSGDREAVEDALKRYGIARTIFAPDNRIVAALDREPGWRRLYADATAVSGFPRSPIRTLRPTPRSAGRAAR